MKIIKAKASKAITIELGEFLVGHFRQTSVAPPNVQKCVEQLYLFLKEGMSFIARGDDGEIIGSIGFTMREFWYSDETFMEMIWLYVDPAHKFGHVGVELLRAGRREADERGVLCFAPINNPDRKQKKDESTLYAQIAGYIPSGYVLKIAGGNRDGR